MNRYRLSALFRLARPVAAMALVSASAGAMAGTFVTSRAGIEYVPAALSAPTATGTAEGSASSLGNEADSARGRSEYTPGSVAASTIVGNLESLSSTLLGQRTEGTETVADGRDRAGNRYVPATYDSFQSWWTAVSADRASRESISVSESPRGNRSGIDQEPPMRN